MVAKTPASESAAGRRSALSAGRALPPVSPGGAPGFPIRNAGHWDKARQAVGRVKNPARRAQLAALLKKTAPMVGRTQALDGSWAATEASNTGMRALLLAGGSQSKCPSCGYQADSNDFEISGGASGTSSPSSPSELRTPVNDSNAGSAGFNAGQIAVGGRGSSGGLSNALRGIELARRTEITSPWDIVVSRSQTGGAIIRHRRGGDKIGEIRKNPDGWTAVVGDGQQALSPHTHQRAALAELIGTHNKGTTTYQHAGVPLQPPPVQTPLMQQFGIPAIRLATPSGGSSDGPRMTTSSSGDDDSGSPGGLNPKGLAIYKNLIGKGFPAARALSFAKRAQSFGSS